MSSPSSENPQPAGQCQTPTTLTLMCLEGSIDPPSRQMLGPDALLTGPTLAYGFWQSDMDLSCEAESLIEFRERLLTTAEKRVALPCEISSARQPGQLRPWKRVWAKRLAGQREAIRGGAQAKTAPPMSTHRNKLRHSQERYGEECLCRAASSGQCHCVEASIQKAVVENQI